jgi:hypothetical protein
MEKYQRTRSIREVKNCHGVEEYVWQNGALVPIQWLREEYRRRLAGTAGSLGISVWTAAELFKEGEHGHESIQRDS